MQQQLADLTAAIQRHLAEVRTTLETRLQALQQGNETRLEQMRATVEEKLQTTLDGVSASRSAWFPSGWSRCTGDWARCRRWPPGSAT